jgi:hypothetical protein
MAKTDVLRQSPASILSNCKTSRKAFDKTWNTASRAPVFCKISKKTLNGATKKVYRTTRLIGSHAYNIAASGAAATAARVLEDECKTLRVEPLAESNRAPWLPGVSKGARMLIDQFLCALAQEATMKAHAVREGAGSTMRLSGKHMRVGWEATWDTVFANSCIMPRTMHVVPIDLKKSAKSKKAADKKKSGDDDEGEEEYAPEEEEGAVEDAE